MSAPHSKTTPESVRWGIIGCGAVTEVKSGPAFQKASGSELVAVMRRTGELAADYARRHGVPRWYDDADRLIADPEVDAVYVATPPGSHLDLALRACRAGKPAYVEKPMARNHDECRLMVEAFRAADQRLFVAYYRRALPRFLEVKALIDAGRLGRITTVRYRYAAPPPAIDPARPPWRLEASESGGGLFFDLGSHALDVLDFLLGPLADVAGLASNRSALHPLEDHVELGFRTDRCPAGLASWDFAAARSEDRLEIVGSAGRIALAVFGAGPIKLGLGGVITELVLPSPEHIEQPMIQSVVDDLLGRGTCASTGETAARTSAVMDAATLGYYGSRASGFWERPDTWPGRSRRDP